MFHARIRARDDLPGRPASDPAVLLAIWLYATLEAIGSARAIERLCQHHAAFRWLAGGVTVNHDMLSAFRRDSGPLWDQLMSQSLTALIAEGLITLEELAIDGTKVRARAGDGSMTGQERLGRIEAAVTERVKELKAEPEQDASTAERKRLTRGVRAAEERAARIERARQRLTVLENEQATCAKRDARAACARSSVSDELREGRMRYPPAHHPGPL